MKRFQKTRLWIVAKRARRKAKKLKNKTVKAHVTKKRGWSH